MVGAGSAGSVITRRLLGGGFSVHVIEAGPVDADPNIHGPRGWPVLLGGALDWSIVTAPQRHANGRSLFWPRGKVLGGSSSLHAMIHIRGHRNDFDGWAADGCTGWDFDRVLPLFARSEDHVDGAGRWYGAGGPLPVERITEPHPTASAFVEAATALGHPVTDDFNGDQMIGVGYNHITTRNVRRASAWQSFVAPVLGNGRLTVTTGALVHRVLVEGGRGGVLQRRRRRAGRASRRGGRVKRRAIGSPKILLLSGVGPAAHLADIGVDVLVDLPGVGANLHDRPVVSNLYESVQPLEHERGNAFGRRATSVDPAPAT